MEIVKRAAVQVKYGAVECEGGFSLQVSHPLHP
jgi:hypothetical protein